MIKKLISILAFITLTIPLIGQENVSDNLQQELGISIYTPWVNNYRFYDYEQNEMQSKSGFVGLGAGLYYRFSDTRKISIGMAFTGDLPVPIGAFDYGKEGIRSNIGTLYLEALYYDRFIKKLGFIIGPNLMFYRYNLTSYVDTVTPYIKTNSFFGLTMSLEYFLTKRITVAVHYRPSIIPLNEQKRYHHLISLDVRYDIKLYSKK
jgi:hypothetical protein